MTTFALVVHPGRPQALSLAERIERWLSERGQTVTRVIQPTGLLTSDLLDAPEEETPSATVEVIDCDPTLEIDAAITAEVDLVVSLGGDGTMLRAVAISMPQGVPVLGVNLGQLGYLTEVEPSGLEAALERFLAGDYEIRRLATLDIDVLRAVTDATDASGPASGGSTVKTIPIPGQPALLDLGLNRAEGPFVALNELVLEKTVPGHTIRVASSVGGRPFMTYTADGVLVATPTGSTAYNLSVRGPLISPMVEALVLTPISPHTMFDRPLVLDPNEGVELRVVGPRSGVLVVDGVAVGILEPGDVVSCRKGKQSAKVVSLGYRDFVEVLRRRFSLSER